MRNLALDDCGEIQRDFRARYEKRGTILAGPGCMCGFDDWEAVFEMARAAIAANHVDHVAVLHFTSGWRDELTEREVDPFDDDAKLACARGELTIVRPEHADKRRHKQLVRALFAAVGKDVALRLKSGKILRGPLRAFDAESQTGSVGGTPFTAAQVHDLV